MRKEEIQKTREELEKKLHKRNSFAEIANDTYDKCAKITCWYKKVRGCEGFCREHYNKFLNS